MGCSGFNSLDRQSFVDASALTEFERIHSGVVVLLFEVRDPLGDKLRN